jgi:flavodoxin
VRVKLHDGEDMKKINFVLSTIAAFLSLIGRQGKMNSAAEQLGPSKTGNKNEKEALPLSTNKNILVAYFSHSGNTREIANHLHESAGGDIVEIQTIKPYPNDYDSVLKQAKQELKSGYKPALKTKIENISSYDYIFIGYPIWCGTIPAAIKTFLSEYDVSGKTIIPFCTQGGGGPGRSVADIAKLCPKSTVLEGIVILGNDAKAASTQVAEWLRKIKITN